MSKYLGDFLVSKTVRCRFNTVNSSGVPTTLTSGAVTISKDGSDVTPSGGVTLTTDAGTVTGRHVVVIDMSADPSTFAAGSEYSVRLSGSSAVGGTSVVGIVVGEWSVGNRSVAVDSSGRVTEIPSAIVQANVVQIAGQTANAVGAVTFPNATLASTSNITAGTITTTTNLTNLPSIPNNWLTAAGIAASALNGKGDWNTTTPPTTGAITTAVAAGILATPANLLATDTSGRVDLGKVLGVTVQASDGTLASATSSSVTFPTTDSAGNAIPDDTRFQYAILGIVSGTGLGQYVLLTTRTGVRTFGVLSGTMPVTLDGTSHYQVLGAWRSAPETSLALGSPRDMSAVADGSLTINDALWSAIGAGIGRKDLSGTTITLATPQTHTTIRSFTIDSSSAPTFLH